MSAKVLFTVTYLVNARLTVLPPCPLYRYNVTGFIDKNKDPIYQDFKRLLYNR